MLIQEMQSTLNVTMRGVRVTIVSMEKQYVLHNLSVCVSVALVTHHAKCMRHTILSSLACPALPYFSTLSHKRYDFWETLLNMKRVF
jgi:hypothetical protein